LSPFVTKIAYVFTVLPVSWRLFGLDRKSYGTIAVLFRVVPPHIWRHALQRNGAGQTESDSKSTAFFHRAGCDSRIRERAGFFAVLLRPRRIPIIRSLKLATLTSRSEIATAGVYRSLVRRRLRRFVSSAVAAKENPSR